MIITVGGLQADITPEQFGQAAGVLQIASFWMMIHPVVWPAQGRQRQRPHRVSWFGWACLYQVMFWSTLARGAHGSLWIVGAECVGTVTMFLLSLKWGSGSLRLLRCTRSWPWIRVTAWPDLLVLCGAAAGLAAWQVTTSASLAIELTVAVDTITALPLVTLLLKTPRTVSLTGWFISGLASLTAVHSVARGQPEVLYLYPVAGLGLDAVVVGAIMVGLSRRAPALHRRTYTRHPVPRHAHGATIPGPGPRSAARARS